MEDIIQELENDIVRLQKWATQAAYGDGCRDSRIDDKIRNKEILIIILKQLTKTSKGE